MNNGEEDDDTIFRFYTQEVDDIETDQDNDDENDDNYGKVTPENRKKQQSLETSLLEDTIWLDPNSEDDDENTRSDEEIQLLFDNQQLLNKIDGTFKSICIDLTSDDDDDDDDNDIKNKFNAKKKEFESKNDINMTQKVSPIVLKSLPKAITGSITDDIIKISSDSDDDNDLLIEIADRWVNTQLKSNTNKEQQEEVKEDESSNKSESPLSFSKTKRKRISNNDSDSSFNETVVNDNDKSINKTKTINNQSDSSEGEYWRDYINKKRINKQISDLSVKKMIKINGDPTFVSPLKRKKSPAFLKTTPESHQKKVAIDNKEQIIDIAQITSEPSSLPTSPLPPPQTTTTTTTKSLFDSKKKDTKISLNSIDQEKTNHMKNIKSRGNFITKPNINPKYKEILKNNRNHDLTVNKNKKTTIVTESFSLTQSMNLAKVENKARIKAAKEALYGKNENRNVTTPEPKQLVPEPKKYLKTDFKMIPSKERVVEQSTLPVATTTTTNTIPKEKNDIVGSIMKQMNNNQNDLNRNQNKENIDSNRTNNSKHIIEYFLYRILKWNINWLIEQDRISTPPPIINKDELLPCVDTYLSYDDYFNAMFPFLLLEIWEELTRAHRESLNNINNKNENEVLLPIWLKKIEKNKLNSDLIQLTCQSKFYYLTKIYY
jgi:hypothetical protein